MPREPIDSLTSIPSAASLETRGDVVLDVELDRGVLYFVLANIGTGPAHAVRVKLDKAVRDLADRRINDNPLYTHLEFLGPGRRVRLLVDAFSEYVRRRQPMKFNVALRWTDDAGTSHKRAVTHDLTAWTQVRESL